MSFREVKALSRRRLRPRGTWTVVILLAALAAHPAAAQVEKILDTPEGWTYRYGVTAATITADVNAGLRPFSLQRTSSTTCDVVTVQNTGDYAVFGFGTGNLHHNRTIAQLGNDLANRRLIKGEQRDPLPARGRPGPGRVVRVPASRPDPIFQVGYP